MLTPMEGRRALAQICAALYEGRTTDARAAAAASALGLQADTFGDFELGDACLELVTAWSSAQRPTVVLFGRGQWARDADAMLEGYYGDDLAIGVIAEADARAARAAGETVALQHTRRPRP